MNDRSKFRVARVVGTALVLLALPAALQAAQARMTSKIVRTLASEDASYGGCMAELRDSVMEATGLDCEGKWVTFSCVGEHTSKATARRLYDSAQLAFVTGRRTTLILDDERKHDSYCFVSRIDVLGN